MFLLSVLLHRFRVKTEAFMFEFFEIFDRLIESDWYGQFALVLVVVVFRSHMASAGRLFRAIARYWTTVTWLPNAKHPRTYYLAYTHTEYILFHNPNYTIHRTRFIASVPLCDHLMFDIIVLNTTIHKWCFDSISDINVFNTIP